MNAAGAIARTASAERQTRATDRAPRTHPPPSEDFRSEIQSLVKCRLFVTGALLKLFASVLCGSHFATRWFAPFVYGFVHSHFRDPWQNALAHGEPLAFPYGPGMLVVLSIPWIPAWWLTFDASSHLGLLLLRIPCAAADFLIFLLLTRWLRMRAREVVVAYWLSPIVLYATYIHGQLDIIPTALLCGALYLVFTRRYVLSGLVFGFALTTKAHLFVAWPFVLVFLVRTRRRLPAIGFAATSFAVALILYAGPLASSAFRDMVVRSAEARRLWSLAIPYGTGGLLVYVAPAALLVAFLRFLSYRKVNRELTLMFVGALYVALVALVPPQPGWFIWSIPFVAYLGARFSRAGRFAMLMLAASYVLFFFIEDPAVFMEACDPTLGAGFGLHAAHVLASAAPALFTAEARNMAWTVLFSATALTGVEMYRRGVRSNAMYDFRDESFMIGIGGDSGSGKHTIGRDLALLLGKSISLVDGDDDHRWERGHAMWRQFTHLNPRGNMLTAQTDSLAALRRGSDVLRRHYDHDKGRFTEASLLQANEFVAIIGLHPFYLASQRQVLHLKVFVGTDESLRRAWKVRRDVERRGYTEAQVLDQIERRMRDGAQYVRPQARHADIIVRHMPPERDDPSSVTLDVELSNDLEPFSILDVLEKTPGITVEWFPEETLARDRLCIRGSASANTIRAAALALVPNLGELAVAQANAWQSGGRGLVQVLLLHAISARLRSASLVHEAK